MLRETDIALLEARPLGRIRMYLEIAQGKSEVVCETQGCYFNLQGEGDRNLDLIVLEDGIAEMIQLGADVEIVD